MKKAIKNIASSKWALPLLAILLLGINRIASIYHARVDLTAEKRFTLGAPTKKLLHRLDSTIHIDIFLSGNIPSGFRQLSGSCKDLLQELREVAGPKLTYSFIAPEDSIPQKSLTYSDSLLSLGFTPINLTTQLKEGQQQQMLFPFGIVSFKGNMYPITLYQGKSPFISNSELNASESSLEYNILSAIWNVSRKEIPLVGYATGNGEPEDLRTYDLIENVLKTNYELYTIDLLRQPLIPADFKALVLVKPTLAFSEDEKLKLDQYVMNGGRLLIFLDRLNAEMDSLKLKNEVIAYDRELNMNDLLFKYGVRVNPDMVMDLQCDFLPFDVNNNGQFQLLPWNYFPVMESANNHPVNKNMGFVSGRFVNSIDTVEAEGIKKTVLLRSSSNTRLVSASPRRISGKENVTAARHESYNRAGIPTAVLLEGPFTSLYANRVTQSMMDTLARYGKGFISRCFTNSKIIVVGDGDIVLNDVYKGAEPLPMGMNAYTYGTQQEFPFANRSFVENCLSYLIDEGGLSELKNKEYKLRLLDKKKTESERLLWQIINLLAPVLVVILLGLLFQYVRTNRYRNKIMN